MCKDISCRHSFCTSGEVSVAAGAASKAGPLFGLPIFCLFLKSHVRSLHESCIGENNSKKVKDQCSVVCWSRKVVVTWKGKWSAEAKRNTGPEPYDIPHITVIFLGSRLRKYVLALGRLFSYKTVSTVASPRLLLEKEGVFANRYPLWSVSSRGCLFVARNTIVIVGATAQQPRL